MTTTQRIPTSTETAEDLFGTSGIQDDLLESSAWTPAFAEDYTLFNATPGRFTITPHFETLTPPSTAFIGHKRQHSSTETLRIDTSGSNIGRHLPRSARVREFLGLPSPSTAKSPSLGGGSGDPTQRTPKTASRIAEERFLSQTATPPQSRHKHGRRNSVSDGKSKMQNDQDLYSQSGTMEGGYDLSFAAPAGVDMFSFPMAGPASVPAYMNGKSFWDPSNAMTDMSMDFADPFAASEDWLQSGDVYQQPTMSTTQAQHHTAQSSRKPRPLMARPPASSLPPVQSGVTFDFGMASLGESPFSMPSTSEAGSPNNLFGFPNMTPPLASNTFNASSVKANSQMELQPQTSLLSPLNIPRSQSVQSKRPVSSHRPMLRPVSPLKGVRPSSRQSMGDNLGRPPALKPAESLSTEVQPPPNFAGKGRYSSGTGTTNRSGDKPSPTKQGSRTNLPAIPETKLVNPRTAVTFSIDSNGRARTETTVIIEGGDDTRPWSSNFRASAPVDSPMSGSSTDEEAIVMPSPNPSFAQKGRNRVMTMQKMARFDTQVKQYPRVVSGGRKLSPGNVKALSKAALGFDEASDEEVIDTARRSGDASKALRRVMENRRRSVSGITSMPPTSNVSTIRISSRHRNSSRDGDRHHRRQSYASSSNTVYSASTPSTGTDLDMDVEMCNTPSTVASESTRECTRCVCHRKEKSDDEFMIQWYVSQRLSNKIIFAQTICCHLLGGIASHV